MTIIEQRLQNFVGRVYTLYKYHDEDNYEDGIPDIYDYLYNWRDEYLDEIDRLKMAVYKNPNDEKMARQLKTKEDVLKDIERNIDIMHNNNDIYYVLPKSTSYYSNPLLVKTCTHELAVAKVDEDNVISFEKTGDKIKCYLLPDDTHGNIWYFTVPEISEYNGKTIVLRGMYIPGDVLFIYNFVKEYNKIRHILCSDCHNVWSMTNSEAAWYAERKLNIPKRCEKCRDINKIRKSMALNDKIIAN